MCTKLAGIFSHCFLGSLDLCFIFFICYMFVASQMSVGFGHCCCSYYFFFSCFAVPLLVEFNSAYLRNVFELFRAQSGSGRNELAVMPGRTKTTTAN